MEKRLPVEFHMLPQNPTLEEFVAMAEAMSGEQSTPEELARAKALYDEIMAEIEAED